MPRLPRRAPRPEALGVKIAGQNIAEDVSLSIGDAEGFFRELASAAGVLSTQYSINGRLADLRPPTSDLRLLAPGADSRPIAQPILT